MKKWLTQQELWWCEGTEEAMESPICRSEAERQPPDPHRDVEDESDSGEVEEGLDEEAQEEEEEGKTPNDKQKWFEGCSQDEDNIVRIKVPLRQYKWTSQLQEKKKNKYSTFRNDLPLEREERAERNDREGSVVVDTAAATTTPVVESPPHEWVELSECIKSSSSLSPTSDTSSRQQQQPQQEQVVVLSEGAPSALPQVVAAMAVGCTQLGVGCVFGLAAVTVQHLTNTNQADLPKMDDFQASLFQFLIPVGAALGSVVSAVPQVCLGQRVVILLSLPVALTAWVALALAPSTWIVLAARAVHGVTLGFVAGPSYNYVTEVSHRSLRGALLSTLGTSEHLGYLLVYGIGNASGENHVPWLLLVLVCGCLATVVPFISLLCLPDSPRWLASRGCFQAAYKSLSFYRGSSYNSHVELADIMHQMQGKRRYTARDQMRHMENAHVLSIFLLFAIMLFASQFTGSFVVSTFLLLILDSAEVSMSPHWSLIVLAAIRVLGSVFCFCVVEHTGRKPLFVSSFLLCAASMTMMGSFFHDQANSSDVSGMSWWLPITCLATFSFFTSVGFAVLNIWREEIIPTAVRSTAVAFLYSLFFVGGFVAFRTHSVIVNSIGNYGTFWLYGFFNVFMVVIGGLGLWETKDLSLELINSTHYNRKSPQSGITYTCNSSTHVIQNNYNANLPSPHSYRNLPTPQDFQSATPLPFNRLEASHLPYDHSNSSHLTYSHSMSYKFRGDHPNQYIYDQPKSSHFTYDYPTSNQFTYDEPKSSQFIYDHPKFSHFMYDHPRSLEITYDHPTSNQPVVRYHSKSTQTICAHAKSSLPPENLRKVQSAQSLQPLQVRLVDATTPREI